MGDELETMSDLCPICKSIGPCECARKLRTLFLLFSLWDYEEAEGVDMSAATPAILLMDG